MANKLYEEEHIRAIANAIRKCTGGTKTYKAGDMSQAVADLEEFANTYLLVTDDGDEIPAVVVEDVTMFDATANDIRQGKVAVTDSGVTEGTKEIPNYHTTTGTQFIPIGSEFDILIPKRYDFTKLQAIICQFNTSTNESVSAEKVVIDDKVYATNSTEIITNVEIDYNDKKIKLGITNNGNTPYVIRFFTYKEEY